MNDLIKKQILFMYKNKIFWAGVLFLIFGSYFLIVPLFQNFSLTNKQKMEKYTKDLTIELSGVERYNYMLDLIIEELERVHSEYPDDFSEELFHEQAYEKFRNEFQNSEKSFDEINKYIDSNFKGIAASESFYQLAQYKKGSFEETNQFVREKLRDHNFSYYFGKKYADYFGILCFALSIILFPFIFHDDLKKDIREVIHTKPIKARQYICGKIAGAYIAMVSVVIIISVGYTALLKFLSYLNGFEFKIFELWFFILLSIFPSLFVCCIISSFIALLCKSSLPAIPVMVLYFFYSNLPLPGKQGWTVKPLTLFLRFDGELFDLVSKTEIIDCAVNQIVMIAISLVLLKIMIWIWGRKVKCIS